MNINRVQQGRVAILAIQGAVIVDDIETLDKSIEETVAGGMVKIVMDFKQVSFIDSVGLERLLNLGSDISRRGGDLRVCALNDICRDIFVVTRLESLLLIFDNRDAAVRSLL